MATLAVILGFALLAGSLVSQTIFFCLVFTFAFLPVRDFTDVHIGFITVETLITGALLGVMGVRMFFYRAHNQVRLSSIWLSWVFIGFGAISATLVIAMGIPEGFKMLYRLAFPIIAFLYFITCMKKEDIEKTLNLIIIIGLGISLAVLFHSLVFGGGWRISAGVERFEGTGSINEHGYSMGLLTIISYVRMRTGGKWHIYGPLAALFALQVLLTITRGAIFATALGLVAFELFGQRGGITARLLLVSALVMGMLAAVLFYAPLRDRIFATHYKDVGHKGTAIQQFEASFEKSGRGVLWRFVIKRVTGDYHLITGYGLGRAEVDVTRYIGNVPHNEYFRMLYEMGIIGLLLFIALLIQLWRIARNGVKHAENNLQLWITGTSVGIVMLYSAGAMVSNTINNYKNLGLFLYMFIAFVLISKMQSKNNGSTRIC